ncbi:NADH-ubiquinone oxidoreductase 10.5 kDa subunit [Penicillium argentinense]|uniref:NADH-ubiquinone oxidoreductase 10.5 kDa subunit n=1 Tax=Penicillium argentinense TaxID=1131581 RepID=A0A9W9KKV9_9EURO|nr:NADH-ubiquinone oxidoreductase 10.5 kDa subunit [Penicillium argentinense]KAJ5110055.1 NADH-ubiquinone oxidoreductase 10.5 kDa subunit [Penicillium argentinense]
MSGKYVFTKGLKELRFLFCQTSEQSAATRYVSSRLLNPGPGLPASRHELPKADTVLRDRSFINRAYPTMKKHNPHTPILMREASGTQPRVFARYELGKEKQEALAGLTDSQIEERITNLVKQS